MNLALTLKSAINAKLDLISPEITVSVQTGYSMIIMHASVKLKIYLSKKKKNAICYV